MGGPLFAKVFFGPPLRKISERSGGMGRVAVGDVAERAWLRPILARTAASGWSGGGAEGVGAHWRKYRFGLTLVKVAHALSEFRISPSQPTITRHAMCPGEFALSEGGVHGAAFRVALRDPPQNVVSRQETDPGAPLLGSPPPPGWRTGCPVLSKAFCSATRRRFGPHHPFVRWEGPGRV